jgi:hypothetical protein
VRNNEMRNFRKITTKNKSEYFYETNPSYLGKEVTWNFAYKETLGTKIRHYH